MSQTTVGRAQRPGERLGNLASGMSVRSSMACSNRSLLMVPASQRRRRTAVVPDGQELLTAAAVLDADDVGFGELAYRPVHGVDRAAQTPGQGLPGRHTGPGAVPVAKQQGVDAERAVGDGCVDHLFGDDREPRFLHDQGPGGRGGVRLWGFSGHGEAFRAGALREGEVDSTAALDGGARQECVRRCTGATGGARPWPVASTPP